MINRVIIKVANGYYVYPEHPSTQDVRPEEISVFNSFEELVKQLREWFEPEEKPSTESVEGLPAGVQR